MLYLILGTNKEKSDKEINKISNGVGILRIDAFSWDADLIRGKLESNSLFGSLGEEEKEVLVLDNISENAEGWEILKSISSDIANSEKDVILLEQDLDKDEIKLLEEAGGEVSDFKEKKGFEYDFSPFALQDAIGAKSAKNSWIEYVKLRAKGIEEEEIAPKIIQKLRDMLAINGGAKKEDLNIKSDFPYNKSRSDLKNWPVDQLQNFYSRLVHIYHDARMGGEELDTALEKELLRI
jgi:DNA polymerase III delta subunit